MFKYFAATLLFVTIQVRAQVSGYERSSGGILMPRSSIQAGSYSELSNFDREFCSPNEVVNSQVKEICFGRLRLRNQVSLSARAFLLTDLSGRKALFVENEIPKVELKSVEFGILGPLGGAALNVAAETGRVRLAIDSRGEVSSVELLTKTWGRLKATRPAY